MLLLCGRFGHGLWILIPTSCDFTFLDLKVWNV
jgi:hypothetical protein